MDMIQNNILFELRLTELESHSYTYMYTEKPLIS